MSRGGNQPNRIPAPATTPKSASKPTHHQPYAVNDPRPAATPMAGARYNIRRAPPIMLPRTPNNSPRNIALAPNFPTSASMSTAGSTTATRRRRQSESPGGRPTERLRLPLVPPHPSPDQPCPSRSGLPLAAPRPRPRRATSRPATQALSGAPAWPVSPLLPPGCSLPRTRSGPPRPLPPVCGSPARPLGPWPRGAGERCAAGAPVRPGLARSPARTLLPMTLCGRRRTHANFDDVRLRTDGSVSARFRGLTRPKSETHRCPSRTEPSSRLPIPPLPTG